MHFLGVDVGGTKTVAVICNEDGEILEWSKGGPGNFQIVGVINATANIKRTIENALNDAEISHRDIDYTYYGVAGADTEYDMEVITTILEKLNYKPYNFENDGWIALRASFFDGIGIVITCGTGSVSFAFDGEEKNRIGGYTPFFGDRLGASNIAGMVMSSAIRAKDGRENETTLLEMIENKAKMPIENLTIFAYESEIEPPFDLVPVLIDFLKEAYLKRDEAAKNIIEEITKEIGKIIKAHLKKLNFKKDLKISLTGSCFKALGEILLPLLRKKYPEYEFFIPEHVPVIGALLLAMESYGIKVDEKLYERLINSYLEKVRL